MRKLIVAAAIAALTVSTAYAGTSGYKKKMKYHRQVERMSPGTTVGSSPSARTMERVGSGQSSSFGRDSGGTRSQAAPGDIGNR